MNRWVYLLALGACAPPTDRDGSGSTADSSAPRGTDPSIPLIPSELGDEVIVVPGSAEIGFYDLAGNAVSTQRWTSLIGECAICQGEGASPDGDGVLVSVLVQGTGPSSTGSVARIGIDGTLDFRVDGFGFPHDVMRDPADDTVMVVETSDDQVTWIAGDGSSSAALRSLGRSSNNDFGQNPNGAERLDHEGGSYLLLTHRGAGTITLWDITTAGDPQFRWRFPSSGAVSVPHAPILREIDGQWWLLWAHTNGIGRDNGSVGLAVTDDPLVAPTYVADLRPGDDVGTFSFLRGVEYVDGRLYLTDSGPRNTGVGRVVVARWPSLSPPESGENGDEGNRRLVDLGDAMELVPSLPRPFEGWLWDQAIEP